MVWKPKEPETTVFYDPRQRALYEDGKASEYDRWRWPPSLRVGRNKHGCFPEVVVRAFFERQGYDVLLSAPK